MMLIFGMVGGVAFGAYAMFWLVETLPRYYDENRICNFAQGAFHIHIPGIPGLVDGVDGAGAALHGGGCPA